VADTPRTFVGPNAPRETAVRYLVRERYPVPAEYVSDLLDVLDAARDVVDGFEDRHPREVVSELIEELGGVIGRFENPPQEETT
jgi:hypothetical protein